MATEAQLMAGARVLALR